MKANEQCRGTYELVSLQPLLLINFNRDTAQIEQGMLSDEPTSDLIYTCSVNNMSFILLDFFKPDSIYEYKSRT